MSDRITIAVVGLGYVGIPVAVAFDAAGHRVIGYDVSPDRVRTLRQGLDPTDGTNEGSLISSSIRFTADPGTLEEAEYILITVPTPMGDRGQPDLDYVAEAGRTIGKHMSPRSTVVLESTVYPGVTRHTLIPSIESVSGLRAGEDFCVGYSPERIDPGEDGWDLDEVVKIVSALDESTLEDLEALYEQIVDAGVHRAPSIEVAETAKCVENIQRDLNIALVNELAMACDSLGIDTDAVLDAAGTKRNFHEYHPGLVGGHCIPVDPFFFIYQSEQNGFTPELVKKGREINDHVPKHVAELTLKALNSCGKVPAESRILVLGLAYKANTGDVRTSAVDGVIETLHEYDVDIIGYDPVAGRDAVRKSFAIPALTEPSFDDVDALVVATAHDEFLEYDFGRVCAEMNDAPAVIDATGELEQVRNYDAHYRKL